MKQIILVMFCTSAIVLTSCQHDDVPEPTTSEKVLGAWKIVKVIDEDYAPINTLVSVDEYIGLPGDSIVFKTNGMVYTYSAIAGDDVTDYIVVDDKTIKIEDELYEIKNLTGTELYLYLEETDQPQNTRYVQKMYFKR